MSLHKRNTKKLVVGDQVIEEKHFADHCISQGASRLQKGGENCSQSTNRRKWLKSWSSETRGHAINYAMVLWNEFKSPRHTPCDETAPLSEDDG